MNKTTIYEIFSRLKEKNPNPESELDYTNPYTMLVAVVLSAQSTDVGVNKATKKLFAAVDTPQKMLDLGIESLKEHIKTIGLFNNKAKNIIALSQKLVDEHNGEVPDDRDALCALPGVGRKTANVVQNTVFGRPYIAVDTHVHRISNRLGLVVTDKPDKTEALLEKVVPDEFKQNAHHWLILHGRYVCKAKKPACPDCFLADLCEFKDKT